MNDYRGVIETIKDQLDIVSLVSERVALKRKGRNWVGLCPFHAEKTPSFTVSPEKQMFYCFGCGVGGDAITFWMKIENLDFTDAVKDLADRLGIKLPKKTMAGSSKWETYHEINRVVKKYFHEILLSSRGTEARNYLLKRGISREMIDIFELGFAPSTYGLKELLLKNGFHPKDASAIGLLKTTQPETYVPIFRHRVIFPIIDERGRTVGFGGRAMGNRLPKYLNTPDSMIYQKGKLFYGEAQTRREISRHRLAILVEGYLDLISLYQLGFKNGIASLGTAFTDSHANRLKRWADQVVLLFDGDEAGYKASTRALEKLTRAGLAAFQATLPTGKDPGDYLTPPDTNALKDVIDRAEDAIIYRMIQASHSGSVEKNLQIQEREIKESLRFLGLIQDSVRLELYIKKAEEILGLKKDILYSIIEDLGSLGKKQRSIPTMGKSMVLKPILEGKQREDPEEVVLTALLQYPELAKETAIEKMVPLFLGQPQKSLVEAVIGEVLNRGKIETSVLMERLGEKEKVLLSRIMVNEIQMTEDQARKAFYDGIKDLHARHYRSEVAALDKKRKELERSGRNQEAMALLRRRDALKKLYIRVLNSNYKSR